ncbi:MAG: hypothetical protein AMXMBFR84_45740 [Candidatus Hydrogenedentota bacterium]
MLNRILDMFATKPMESSAPDPERLKVATCVLLLEVAGADNEFAPEECEHIINTLQRRFALSQQDAEELLQLSSERRQQSIDLWKYTNQVNETCTTSEKIEIIREVWRVIYADGTVDGHEDYLVHKMARLMNLNHPQLISSKLDVLKEIRGE